MIKKRVIRICNDLARSILLPQRRRGREENLLNLPAYFSASQRLRGRCRFAVNELIVICLSFVLAFLLIPIDGLGVQTALAQHAGHGGAPPAQPEPAKKQLKEQPKEQQEVAEVPTVEIPLDKQQMMELKTVLHGHTQVRRLDREAVREFHGQPRQEGRTAGGNLQPRVVRYPAGVHQYPEVEDAGRRKPRR